MAPEVIIARGDDFDASDASQVGLRPFCPRWWWGGEGKLVAPAGLHVSCFFSRFVFSLVYHLYTIYYLLYLLDMLYTP